MCEQREAASPHSSWVRVSWSDRRSLEATRSREMWRYKYALLHGFSCLATVRPALTSDPYTCLSSPEVVDRLKSFMCSTNAYCKHNSSTTRVMRGSPRHSILRCGRQPTAVIWALTKMDFERRVWIRIKFF